MIDRHTVKLTLTCLCFSLTSITTSATENSKPSDTSRLLPEVAPIVLELKTPDPQRLKQNVYAAMLAIDAPLGMSPSEIGAKIVANNFALFKHAMATHKNIDREKYDFASKRMQG